MCYVQFRNYSGSNNGSHVNHQTEMKNKVLRWLMSHSQHLINSARFPLDEVGLFVFSLLKKIAS